MMPRCPSNRLHYPWLCLDSQALDYRHHRTGKLHQSRRKSGHDKTPCITDLAALATVTSPRHEDYDASDDDSEGDDDGSDHGHRDGGANADNSDNGT